MAEDLKFCKGALSRHALVQVLASVELQLDGDWIDFWQLYELVNTITETRVIGDKFTMNPLFFSKALRQEEWIEVELNDNKTVTKARYIGE